MKIAHVVTYASVDGAFGGPIAVATAHAEELARRGHDVDLIAGWDGKLELSIPGVRVRLFPVKHIAPGLSGLTSPGLHAFLRKSSGEYDAVHIHMGRDLVTLPSALIALRRSARVVVQTHGMVMPDRRIHVRVVDAILTKPALRGANVTFVLTDAEEAGIRRIAGRGGPRIVQIANGVGKRAPFDEPRDEPATVLFLARLHPRKRVMAFAEAARILSHRGLDATFRVVGPDEGDLPSLLAFKKKHGLNRLVYAGAVPPGESLRELAKATVFVLPSRGEVFPMTVLESMSVRTPVILTSDCAMSPEIERRAAGVVSGLEPESIAEAIQRLVEDSTYREQLVASADIALSEWLSIEAVVESLVAVYAGAARGQGGREKTFR